MKTKQAKRVKVEVERSECGNCSTVWADTDLNEIKDYFERVEKGETVPSGECPLCGALADPTKRKITDSVERLVKVAGEAVGRPVEMDEIGDIFNDLSSRFDSLTDAKKELKKLVRQFEEAGGRGVELADKIDKLRIYIATAS